MPGIVAEMRAVGKPWRFFLAVYDDLFADPALNKPQNALHNHEAW